MLLFAAGSSYHHLCAANLIDCPPCQSESSHSEDENAPCKSCGDSAKLEVTVQTSKPSDGALGILFIAVAILSETPFPPQAEISGDENPEPSAELPLAAILRDIKQSIPIRGPSILA